MNLLESYIRKMVREVLEENIGPGPSDIRPVSQVYMDVYNRYFESPEFVRDYDPENGVFLYDDEFKKRMGKIFLDNKFKGDINKYQELTKGWKDSRRKSEWKNFNKNVRH